MPKKTPIDSIEKLAIMTANGFVNTDEKITDLEERLNARFAKFEYRIDDGFQKVIETIQETQKGEQRQDADILDLSMRMDQVEKKLKLV